MIAGFGCHGQPWTMPLLAAGIGASICVMGWLGYRAIDGWRRQRHAAGGAAGRGDGRTGS